MRFTTKTSGLWALGFVVLAHCSSDSDAPQALTESGRADVDGMSTGGNVTPTAGTGSVPDPPEIEVESRYEAPVVTGELLWVANPASGRVALVHAETLEVKTAEAGFAPTYLAAVPGPSEANAAIVINALSHDATLLTVNDKGGIDTQSAPVHAKANSWSISENGRWALAWTDAQKITGADPTEGFQDITVVDLASDELVATRLSVGYRPSRVLIDPDEELALVLTEPGITVIDLQGSDEPEVVKDVALPPGPNASQREAVITPDGRLALVRHDNSQIIHVIQLETSEVVQVVLDAPVTDLDLSADGKTAVAVLRGRSTPGVDASGNGGTAGTSGSGGGATGHGGTSMADSGAPGLGEGGAAGAALSDEAAETAGATGESAAGMAGASSEAAGATAEAGAFGAAGAAGLAGMGGSSTEPGMKSVSQVVLLEVDRIFEVPDSYRTIEIENEIVGSVSVPSQGPHVLLYTNATASDRLTILNTQETDYRTVVVNAPIQAVIPTGNGSHAVALLKAPERPGAFSLVPIEKNLPPKIQGTDAPIQAVAVLPDSDEYALVTTRGNSADSYGVYLAKMPELQVDRIVLSSAPTATGMVPAMGLGFVAQEHPEGRITFVDLAARRARTLTGFELGVKVVDGE